MVRLLKSLKHWDEHNFTPLLPTRSHDSINRTMSDTTSIHHGSCLCEAVKYTVGADPSLLYLCHCRNCQKASGSAFNANCFFPRSAFDVVHGKDSLTVFRFDGTGSGSVQHRHACGVCGSPLFILPEAKPEIVVVFASTLDNFDNFLPVQECWVKRRCSWLQDIDGAEIFAESRPIASGRPSLHQ